MRPKSIIVVDVFAPWWLVTLPSGKRWSGQANTKSEARAFAKRWLRLECLPPGTTVDHYNGGGSAA